MSSMLSMSSMTIAAPLSVFRREVEQVSDDGEPEESETGEREKGRIEFVPDCPVLTEPGIDRVIEDHQSAHRAQNTDELSEVNPFIEAGVERGNVRKPVHDDARNTSHAQNVES